MKPETIFVILDVSMLNSVLLNRSDLIMQEKSPDMHSKEIKFKFLSKANQLPLHIAWQLDNGIVLCVGIKGVFSWFLKHMF